MRFMFRARGRDAVREEIAMIQELMLSPIFIILDIFLGGIFISLISYSYYHSLLLSFISFVSFVSICSLIFYVLFKFTKKENDLLL